MSERLKTIEQLDTLRFIAVFLVIFCHYFNFTVGQYGVQIFFTISGFLITYILLSQKETVSSRISIIKNFYIKRTLRIFPVYYLLIILLTASGYLFNVWAWDKNNTLYYYTYTSNILYFLEGSQDYIVSHTWSLAVEEQFYLIWPFIILFLLRQRENIIMYLLIIISLLFKVFADFDYGRNLPVAQFDSLASGALIAFFLFNKKYSLIDFINRYKFVLILVSSGLIIAANYFLSGQLQKFSYPAILILSTSLLVGCIRGFKGVAGLIFNYTPFQYLGKISYGIYLYHKLIPPLVIPQVVKIFHIQPPPIIYYTLAIIITLVAAHFSYVLIEQRFLKLKERFEL